MIRRSLKTLTPLPNSRENQAGNTATLQAQSVGDAALIVRNGKGVTKIWLLKTLYAPSKNTALIKASQLCTESKYTIVISPTRACMFNGRGKAVAHVKRFVSPNRLHLMMHNVCRLGQDPRCLGALHRLTMYKCTVTKVLKMESIENVDDLHDCLACGKYNTSRRSRVSRTSVKLVVQDIVILISAAHHRHPVEKPITDDCSKFRKVCFLKNEDEAADCIRQYVA